MNLQESLTWPVRDASWLEKVLVTGLIGLIPLFGGLCIDGWMLTTLDNLRADRRDLAPIGFHYQRGLNLFVVHLVYVAAGLLLLATGLALYLIFLLAAQHLTVISFIAAFATTALMATLLGAAFGAAEPLIAEATERGGIEAGINPVNVVHFFAYNRAAAGHALVGGIVAYALTLAGGLLSVLGLVFAVPYSRAMLAAVIHRYEVESGISPK